MHSHMICTRPCAIVTNSTTFRSCPLLEAGFQRLEKRPDPGNETAPRGSQRRQTGRPSRLRHPLQVVLTDGVSEPLLVVEMSLNSTTYPDLPVASSSSSRAPAVGRWQMASRRAPRRRRVWRRLDLAVPMCCRCVGGREGVGRDWQPPAGRMPSHAHPNPSC